MLSDTKSICAKKRNRIIGNTGVARVPMKISQLDHSSKDLTSMEVCFEKLILYWRSDPFYFVTDIKVSVPRLSGIVLFLNIW